MLSDQSKTYERARLSRDSRFDGVFFTGVLSTGIFCRPICPAPPPKPENVRYFKTASAALDAGLRPCLRCKPETAPDSFAWAHAMNVAEPLLSAALKHIEAGYLQSHTVGGLADLIGISTRHLSRLFKQHLGTTPLVYARHQQLLLAYQMVIGSDLSFTLIAMASGYRSVRQFNDQFLKTYGCSPSQLRSKPSQSKIAYINSVNTCRFQFAYKPPYDFQALLDYYRSHAVEGVEQVSDHDYIRTFHYRQTNGWFKVSHLKKKNALLVELSVDQYTELTGIIQNIKRMFDIATSPLQIRTVLASEPKMLGIVEQHPGLRLTGCWNIEEALIRAVLGQRVSLHASMKMLQRVANQHAKPITSAITAPATLKYYFPTLKELNNIDSKNLRIGRAQALTLQRLSTIEWNKLQQPDVLIEKLSAIKGIGQWTIDYTLLRALAQPDIWLNTDAAVRNAIQYLDLDINQNAEYWQPWRSYAVLYLWKSLENLT